MTTEEHARAAEGGALERLVVALRTFGPMTQAELARRTDLSPATVSLLVRRLAGDGRARIRPARRNGRVSKEVQLAGGGDLVAGIDVGRRHFRVALSTLDYGVVAEAASDLAADHDAEETLATVAGVVRSLLAQAEVPDGVLVRAALGLPAPIERGTGRVGSSSILQGWVDVQPGEQLSTLLGVPVEVDNDANLGALAESVHGAGRGRRDLAYIKVSHGIGAGLILGGELYRGAGGTAGELGHVTVQEGGALCRCGNRGCAEMLAGTDALLEAVRPVYGEVTLEEVLHRAASGDPRCRRVLADCGHQLGRAVAALCVLLNPEVVVIGGPVAEAGELVLEPLRAEVARLAVLSAARTPVVPSTTGARSEVVGALALGVRSHLRSTPTV